MFSVKQPQQNWFYINKSKKYALTGLSDHQKLISTLSKSGSFKGATRIKLDQSYKSFNINNSKSILNQNYKIFQHMMTLMKYF